MQTTINIVLLLSVGCAQLANSQNHCDYKYDSNWVMGSRENDDSLDRYGGHILRFDPDFRIERRAKQSGQLFTFAAINSKSGNLLLYSNGCDIFDHRDSIIKNGTGINPGEVYDEYCPNNYGYPGLSNMLFLPDPYDSSIYRLIHIREINNWEPNAAFIVQFDHFYITTIHTTKDNGFAEVIEKNKIVFTDTGMIGQPVAAVRHANGLDWWIITPDRWNSDFHTVLLNNEGFQYTGKQSIGNPSHPRASGGQGKFSPDGSIFAWFQPRNGLFIYDFDRNTGLLSNFRKVDVPIGADLVSGGTEFSPSGRFLYVNHYFSLYQVDLISDDLQESLTHIADYDGFGDPPFYTTFLGMQGTPDKRIIMNVRNGSEWLHVIQEPEKKGIACRFEQHAIELPTVNNFTLPIFPNYRLGPLGAPLCDSMVVSTTGPDDFKTSDFLLIPNPASDYVEIKSIRDDSTYPITITISDLTGHIVHAGTTSHISTRHLSPGLYLVNIIDHPFSARVLKLIISPH